MNEQTQNIATALKWCQEENQKLRQELYDLKKSNAELAQFCQESVKGFDSLNSQIAKQKQEIKEYEYESNESGVKEQKLYGQVFTLSNEKKVLEEQLEQQNEWFEEINVLVGADPEEPAVNSVSDFVRRHQ
jgi:chromosome segregation ATPase